MEKTKETTNTNISFVCKGECGVGLEEGKETITPPEINLCFGCKYKREKTEKTEGPIPLK